MLCNCSGTNEPDTNTAGTATETENVAIVGMLYQSDGTAPAQGAQVVLRTYQSLADTFQNAEPQGSGQSSGVVTIADADGRFVIDTVNAGLYTIEAQNDNELALIDSVRVTQNDDTLHVSDTLQAPGAITGRVRLSGNADPRSVFILGFGINRFVMPDTNGFFTFDSLAPATYDLRILPRNDTYPVRDIHDIFVQSGDVTSLDTIVISRYGIPPPKGVRLDYDSCMQIVTLSWYGQDTEKNIRGYNVFRRHIDSVYFKRIASALPDTMYKDSSLAQGETYEYSVAALDSMNRTGTKSSVHAITAKSAYTYIKTFGGRGDGKGRFNHITDISVRHDTIFIAEAENKRIQLIDTTGSFISFLDYGNTGITPTGLDICNGMYYIIDNKTSIYRGNSRTITPMVTPGFSIKSLQVKSPDSIYLADADNQRIVLIDSAGNRLAAGSYTFEKIGGIALSESFVLATDMNTRRLVFLTPSLLFHKDVLIEPKEKTTISGISRSNYICEISVDNNGYIYIGVMTDTARIDVLRNNGTLFGRFFPSRHAENFLHVPGLHITPNGFLYICTDSDKIQVYTCP